MALNIRVPPGDTVQLDEEEMPNSQLPLEGKRISTSNIQTFGVVMVVVVLVVGMGDAATRGTSFCPA